MNIYTRAGDKGTTQLVGGKKVEKFDLRVEAYGTVDELNSWVGFIISQLNTAEKSIIGELENIQHELFDLGTDLATPADSPYRNPFPAGSAEWLEKKIDHYSEELPEIRQFILPGGTQSASSLHIARTITRRCERLIAALDKSETVNPEIMKYMNRLSDYFFVLARWVNVKNDMADRMYQKKK